MLFADRWLLSVCSARVLLYANFMVYAACIPSVMRAWNITATQAGTIAAGFMAGSAVSLFASSWLADHYGAKRIFVWSAIASAGTALLFGLFARSYMTGLVFYALAASTQGGMYTPVIMLIADRYPPSKRGSAMGYLIASTSVAYAFSLAVSGLCLTISDYRAAFIVTGIMPLIGLAILLPALRSTGNRVHARTFHRPVREVFRTNRNVGYLAAGYTFHCWELLGMWSWTPAFFSASVALAGGVGDTAEFGAYLTAGMHIVGSIASTSMGGLSDRLGRRHVLITVSIVGAMTSFCIGWLVSWPIVWLVLVGLFYYYTTVGDSAVLSTAISEEVEPGYLGSVLAIRALMGFAAGAVAPVVFGMILDASNDPGTTPSNWGWAFMSLGLGGVLAAWCAYRYQIRKEKNP